MIVLGLDPARTSGWCIMSVVRGSARRELSGVVDDCAGRAHVIHLAVEVARRDDDRLAICYERHTVGGGAGSDGKGTRWTPDVMMGMGEARGRWLEQLELAGIARSHCVGVTPSTWRKATLPRCGRDRAALKAAALLSCKARGWGVESDDEAEACLIAYWGAVGSAEVAALARRRAA